MLSCADEKLIHSSDRGAHDGEIDQLLVRARRTDERQANRAVNGSANGSIALKPTNWPRRL